MKNIKKLLHKWLWTVLLVFCIAGIFYPAIGAAALICMLAPVVTAFFGGRFWCGNFCPRGSLNDIIVPKISRKSGIPKLFKKSWFKLLFFAVLMGGFAVQITIAWGSAAAVGAVFVRMIIITTLLSLLLGSIFSPRTWCTVCPMGTLSQYISALKPVSNKISHVTFNKEKCVNCKICSRACPIDIDVLMYKNAGKVTNASCLKCEACVGKCPKKSLYME